MLSITVFTKPNCPQCTATTKHLDRLVKKGLLPHYATQPINAEVLQNAAEAGITSAPIVFVERGLSDEMWGGYRPDSIDALAKEDA